jgi:hypothetical protein
VTAFLKASNDNIIKDTIVYFWYYKIMPDSICEQPVVSCELFFIRGANVEVISYDASVFMAEIKQKSDAFSLKKLFFRVNFYYNNTLHREKISTITGKHFW